MLTIKKQLGFTIIEAMVAISILGVMAAVAVPSVSSMMESFQLKTAAQSVLSGIQQARSEAVKRGYTITFRLNKDLSWNYGCIIANYRPNCPDVIFSNPPEKNQYAKVNFTPNGSQYLVFNGYGTLNSTYSGMSFSELEFASKAAGSTAKTLKIMVSPAGSVRMCDPSISSTTDPRRC